MTAIARPSTPFPHTHTISHSYSYFESQPSSSSSTSSRRYSQPLHFQLPTIPARMPPSLLKRSASSSSSTSASAAGSQSSGSKHFRSSPATPPLIARRESASSSTSTSTEESSSPTMPATPPHANIASTFVPPASKQGSKSTQAQAHQSFAAFYPEFDLDSMDGPLTAIEILEDDLYDLKRSQAEDFYRPAFTPPSTPLPIARPSSKVSVSSNTKFAFDPTFYPPRSQPSLFNKAASALQQSPARPKFKRRDTPRPVETISSLAFSSLGRQPGLIIEEKEEKKYTSMIDGAQWIVVA